MMKDTIRLSMVWKTGDSCRMYGDICRLRGSHREAAKTFDCLNVALRTHCFMLNAIFRTLDLRLVPVSVQGLDCLEDVWPSALNY